MFKLIRRKRFVKGIFFILIISMIISAFIFWGTNVALKNKKDRGYYIGRILNKNISSAEFARSLKSSYILAQLRFGDEFYKVKDLINLNLQAWQRLIILGAANEKKITINDRELVEYLHRFPLFQSKEEFSLELYKIITANLGMPEREFEEMMRQQLAIEKFYDEVTKNINTTEQEILEEYEKENEVVDLDIVSITPQDLKNEIDIILEEARTYFKDNAVDFKEPDKVDIQYLGIEYEENATNEQINEIKNNMDNIYQKLKQTKEFTKVAEDNTLVIKETGFFSINEPIPQLGWLPEFSKEAFLLKKEDAFSKPVDTVRGCYILKLKEFKPTHIPDFEEAKDKVIDVLKTKKATDIAKDKAVEYKKKIEEQFNKNPKLTLKEITDNLKIKCERIEGFKRNEYLRGVGFSKEAEAFSFDLTKEGLSDVIETPVGFFIIKRINFKGIDEEKFKSESESFKEKILQQKKALFFQEYLDKELKPKTSLSLDLNQDKYLPY